VTPPEPAGGAGTPLARRLLRTLLALRTAWVMVGLTIVLALLLEVGGHLYYAARALFSTRDDRTQLDAMADAPWAEAYFDEIDRSAVTQWYSYVYWRRRPFAGEYINVDERGMRRTWQAPRADGLRAPLKIWVLGGSTVWGAGARDDQTIPSWLAKVLAERAPGVPVEVRNYGESGYVSTQELLTLEREIQRGEVPDLTVSYHGINDVFASFQNGVAGSPQNEFNRRIDFENFGVSALLRIAKASAALRPVMWRVSGGAWDAQYSQRTPEMRRQLARETVSIYARNVAILEALAQRFGFAALFYWQPVIFTKPNLSEGERWIHDQQEYIREFFGIGYEIARSSPELTSDPRFHDIAGIFGEEARPFYIDCCHTNEAANEIIARRIAEDVVPLLPSLR
jgi:lysophospholipase L1-like esterase